MNYVVDVMGACYRKGIRIWSENGQLRYKAPRGLLTKQEVDELRRYREQIVSLLGRSADAESANSEPQLRLRGNRAPLTFTQLAHWNFFQLSKRRSSAFISLALRLRGPLNIHALRRSVAEIVRRHDALRTQIHVVDGAPVQEIAPPGDFEMTVDDLMALSEVSRDLEVERLMDEHAFRQIDVAVDPLFWVQLLAIRDDEHLLLLSMDHIISDGSSMTILLRELLTAYTQAAKDAEISLPAASLQLADYALWQSSTHRSWTEKHAPYWEKHLKGCERLRFPSDKNTTDEEQMEWDSVSFRMGRNLKAELQEWGRLKRTTLVMSVFTAYVALVLRWCNTPEAIFLYHIEGRVGETIRNTIGYFAFPLYLRIRASESDSFSDLLARVTDEYCKAYEHADFSYMAAQALRPGFSLNSVFNWVGQGFTKDVVDSDKESIELYAIPFKKRVTRNPGFDAEPVVIFYELDHEIQGSVHFPTHRFSVDLMSRFTRNIPRLVTALLRQPDERVSDVLLL